MSPPPATTGAPSSPTLHDEACYRMLWLKHTAKCPDDELERAFDSLCTTVSPNDPFWVVFPSPNAQVCFRHDDPNLHDDIRRISSFCDLNVCDGRTDVR